MLNLTKEALNRGKMILGNLVSAPAKDECPWCAHQKSAHASGLCKDCNCKAGFENTTAVDIASCICGHAERMHDASGTRRCTGCSCIQYLKDD